MDISRPYRRYRHRKSGEMRLLSSCINQMDQYGLGRLDDPTTIIPVSAVQLLEEWEPVVDAAEAHDALAAVEVSKGGE